MAEGQQPSSGELQARAAEKILQDVETKEPRIPNRELGEPTTQLINDFTQVIKRTPEFVQALSDWYFNGNTTSTNPHNHEHRIDKVKFDKGDSSYTVQYWTAPEGDQSLIVEKRPLQAEDRDVREETMRLQTYKNFTGEKCGNIHLTKYDVDKNEDTTFNTLTTIQRAKDFLTTNFGEPQVQPPTE
jgi:hypothetical protein